MLWLSSFLVTAMSHMFKDANPDEVENIRKNGYMVLNLMMDYIHWLLLI